MNSLATASLLALVLTSAPAESKPTRQLTLLVPAYFYPAEQGLKEWNRLIAAADKALN